MLAGEDPDNEARFFSQTSEALSSGGGGQQAAAASPPRVAVVFVEVVAGTSRPSTSEPSSVDRLIAWNELQRLRDCAKDKGAFLLVSGLSCSFRGGVRPFTSVRHMRWKGARHLAAVAAVVSVAGVTTIAAGDDGYIGVAAAVVFLVGGEEWMPKAAS